MSWAALPKSLQASSSHVFELGRNIGPECLCTIRTTLRMRSPGAPPDTQLGAVSFSRLFNIPRRVVQDGHRRACKLAGIPDYTIHDHRHTFGVALAKEGMPLTTLQKQLGHQHIATTLKYASYHPSYKDAKPYLRAAQGRLGSTPGNELGNRATATNDGISVRETA